MILNFNYYLCINNHQRLRCISIMIMNKLNMYEKINLITSLVSINSYFLISHSAKWGSASEMENESEEKHMHAIYIITNVLRCILNIDEI